MPDIATRAIRLGREVTGKEAEEALKRDHGRKSRADPMGSLFRSSAASGMKGPVLQPKATGVEMSDSASVEFNRATTHRDGTQRPRNGKRVKKGKRDKKEKKRKSKSTKERRRHSDRDIATTGGVIPAGAGDSLGHLGEAVDAERQQSLVRTASFLARTCRATLYEGVEKMHLRVFRVQSGSCICNLHYASVLRSSRLLE